MKTSVERQIRQFIEDNFMFRATQAELSDSESLLDAGLIDSTGILELITFLETQFLIEIAAEDAIPENLDSIKAIAAFIESKLAAT